ncbi:MAG: penicillin-binding protein 2 [Candidatus Omnitrophica bacterium]|nr:penicillin-binding protein 2 [Candidatus Omnitrophota bacterium]
MRIHILTRIIFLSLGFVVAALVYMQIIRGGYYHAQSVNNRIRIVPIDAPRGRILDRNGVVLADNRPSYHVAVIPQDMEDPNALFGFIGRVLNKDPRVLAAVFTRRKLTPFDPVIVAQDVDRAALITVEENRFQYPGLVIEQGFERFYPFHEAGSHAVGYVGKIDPTAADVLQGYGYTPSSLVGKNGVEQFYESELQGAPGGRQIEVNNRGREVRLLGTKAPGRGRDITISLDQRLQSMAAELLGERRGSVVMMDLSNGEVLALVSSPAFDPNVFTDRSRRGRIDAYMQNAQAPLFNRAITGQYPPGSVFKVPLALAAVERKAVTPGTAFDCPGYYMLGKARFGCAHVHGPEDLIQAIAHSCNVYFFHAGQMVTAPIMGAYARVFGLDHPTGIDLPFEAKGNLVLPGHKKGGWFTGNTLNLAIGQGDTLATPLQLTVMIAAVANDGIILRPRVLKAFDGKPVRAPDLSRRPIIRLRDATWRVVQNGLRRTVDDPEGTARGLSDLKGLAIAGKTGTAQAGKEGDHAWFAGYVRSPKNNLAFCVLLEHGGPSSNAVLLARDLLARMQAEGII